MDANARAITIGLKGKWAGSYGLARCPVHVDKTPSLKVRDDARKDDGIDLHCFAGCDWKDIKDALKRQGLLPEFHAAKIDRTLVKPRETLPPLPEPQGSDDKLRRAKAIWQSAKPLTNTLGFRYFTEHRELHIGALGDLCHALRWHGGSCAVIALMTTPIGNAPCGVHRTFLNQDATKRERKMLGRAGIVRLSPDKDMLEGLSIVEGVEDGLAVLASGWAPVWAALSCGGIERFPVLPGIEALTIFRDRDDAGRRAAEACAEIWAAAGREVFLT